MPKSESLVVRFKWFFDEEFRRQLACVIDENHEGTRLANRQECREFISEALTSGMFKVGDNYTLVGEFAEEARMIAARDARE
jgi:hypothetical protein